VKLVIAIIQPTKLNAVREALEKVEVHRMTVCDSQGFGQQRGRSGSGSQLPSSPVLIRKIVLEIVVNNDFLKRTVETIAEVARTGPRGTVGDGKIFVLSAEQAVQVDDAFRGPGAV